MIYYYYQQTQIRNKIAKMSSGEYFLEIIFFKYFENNSNTEDSS